MKNGIKWIRIVLALVLVLSIAMVLRQWLDNSGGEQSYADARELALGGQPAPTQPAPAAQTLPPETQPAGTEPAGTEPPKPVWVPVPPEEADPVLEELAGLDLAALQAENPDVAGWIRIPGTKVDYPILQGQDNEFYLKHTWQQLPNSVGSIFLECSNRQDLMDFNTIVYGHNMRDGSMFATIRQYSSQNYFDEHPYVYIRTAYGAFRYEIFSSYQARVDSATYGLSFRQEQTRLDYLAMAQENSVIETGIAPAPSDRILTLSTCDAGGNVVRWVVHARLRMMEIYPQ